MYHGLVLGHEPRQTMAAARLAQLGAELSGEGDLDFILLPFGIDEPVKQMARLKPGGVCFGIRPGAEIKKQATEQKVQLVDLNQEPGFKHRNAVSTAEAALALAIGNTRDTLFGSQVLVIGYGAIGRRLCRLLTALGAKVTGSARKPEDLVQIVLEGCRAVHTEALAQTGRPYAIVFNTVPAPVLTPALTEQLPKDCFILDLASGCGGLAGETPKGYLQALQLPGKTAPQAAARAAADTVWDILEVGHAAG